MKVFTCKGFRGHNPVGTAAVVVAQSAEEAALLLTGHLHAIGLPQTIEASRMEEVKTDSLHVRVLCDGDY